MRIVVLTAVLIATLWSWGCCSRTRIKAFKPGPDYDCKDPGSAYPAVTKRPQADGHCIVEWDLDKGHLDYPDHPEIGLLTFRPGVKIPDEMRFKSTSGKNFHYRIEPNPAGATEVKCYGSPVGWDPTSSSSQSHHDLGGVQINPGGPPECHFKITFTLDDANSAAVDPHIKIGSGAL